MLFNKRLRDSVKEDFFLGGGEGLKFFGKGQEGFTYFFYRRRVKKGVVKNSVDVREGNLKKFCPFKKYSLPSLQYT